MSRNEWQLCITSDVKELVGIPVCDSPIQPKIKVLSGNILNNQIIMFCCELILFDNGRGMLFYLFFEILYMVPNLK